MLSLSISNRTVSSFWGPQDGIAAKTRQDVVDLLLPVGQGVATPCQYQIKREGSRPIFDPYGRPVKALKGRSFKTTQKAEAERLKRDKILSAAVEK